MLVDLQQREFLAQLVLVPVVRVDVDRLSKKKRFIESVELLLNRLRPPLNVGNVATDLSLALLPGTQHMLFHEPHVARSRLQLFQLVDEQPFQLPFRDIYGAALTPAVVVRVVAVSSLRPARGQRPAAGLTPDKTLQRELGPRSQVRAGHLNASFEDRLNAVERLVADKWFKVATPRHVEFRNMNQAGIQPIREHAAEALRVERQPLARAESKPRDFAEDFLLRESAGCELLEGLRDERATIRIRDKVLA